MGDKRGYWEGRSRICTGVLGGGVGCMYGWERIGSCRFKVVLRGMSCVEGVRAVMRRG